MRKVQCHGIWTKKSNSKHDSQNSLRLTIPVLITTIVTIIWIMIIAIIVKTIIQILQRPMLIIAIIIMIKYRASKGNEFYIENGTLLLCGSVEKEA